VGPTNLSLSLWFLCCFFFFFSYPSCCALLLSSPSSDLEEKIVFHASQPTEKIESHTYTTNTTTAAALLLLHVQFGLGNRVLLACHCTCSDHLCLFFL
jgi:hypothetical protein